MENESNTGQQTEDVSPHAKPLPCMSWGAISDLCLDW